MNESAFQQALRLLNALHQEAVEYVLVGGLAMGFQGLARATEDVDLFVRPTSDNLERLRKALRGVWDDPHIEDIVYEDLAGEYPVVRYGPPDAVFVVDILARLGEAFSYEDLEAETREVRNIPVRVATPRTLFLMKRDTVRPRDRMDAAALLQTYPELEES